MGTGDVSEGVVKRRGCSCSKGDFIPEESFQSWGNYGKAWSEIGLRLKDRVLTRSLDDTEINEVKARSQHEMKKTLNWWDLIWFGIGAVIGAGIFVLTGLEANTDAGPAVVLSYVVSGVSAMLSVFCYTEFAVEIPVTGNCKTGLGSLSQNRMGSLSQNRGTSSSTVGAHCTGQSVAKQSVLCLDGCCVYCSPKLR